MARQRPERKLCGEDLVVERRRVRVAGLEGSETTVAALPAGVGG